MTNAGIDLLFYALGMEFGDAYTGWQGWTTGVGDAVTYGAWRAQWQEHATIADLVADGMLVRQSQCPHGNAPCVSLHYAVTDKGKKFMQNCWACPESDPNGRRY